MKNHTYEITYKELTDATNEVATWHTPYGTKQELVEDYIRFLKRESIYDLKAFKNGRDITAKINEFLSK